MPTLTEDDIINVEYLSGLLWNEQKAPPSIADIANELHISREQVAKAQRILVKRGRLEQNKKRQYVPTDKVIAEFQRLPTEDKEAVVIATLAMEYIAALTTVAAWFEGRKVERLLGPNDIYELVCKTIDRKISRFGASRFTKSGQWHLTEVWRETMQFYGNPNNWAKNTDAETLPLFPMAYDEGEKARAALKLWYFAKPVDNTEDENGDR